MAKLPEIQQSRAAALQTINPQTAMAPHLAKMRMGDQVVEMANEVYNMKAEQDAHEAYALRSESIAQLEEDMANRVEPFDQAELDSLGIYDVELDKNGTAEAWRVYPALIKQKLGEFREEYGSTIKHGAVRRQFDKQVMAEDERMISGLVQDAASKAVKDVTLTAVAKSAEFAQAGMFDAARAAYKSSVWDKTPELAAEKVTNLNALDIAEEEWKLNKMLMTDDPAEIESAVDYFLGGDFAAESKLTPGQQLAYGNAAILRRKAMVTAADKEEGEQQDFNTTEALAGLYNGTTTQADIIANRHAYGRTNFAFLVGQARTLAEGKTFVTDPLTEANFERSVLELQSGNFEGNDYGAEVDLLEQWILKTAVITDERTGEQAVNISPGDVNTMRTRIDMLRKAPMESPAYKSLVKEISNRIRGGSDSLVQIGPQSPEIANAYADAMISLNNYVEENGGTKADVSKWRRESLPEFLKPVAKLALFQVPKLARDSVEWKLDGTIDVRGTQDIMTQNLSRSTSDEAKKEIRAGIAAFDAWAAKQKDNM